MIRRVRYRAICGWRGAGFGPEGRVYIWINAPVAVVGGGEAPEAPATKIPKAPTTSAKRQVDARADFAEFEIPTGNSQKPIPSPESLPVPQQGFR